MTTNSSIQACHSQAAHAQPNDVEEDDIIIFTERPGRLEKAIYAIRTFKNHNIGLLLIMASEAFFALMNVSVKFLNRIDPPVPPLELILIRMLITYVCCVIYFYATKTPDPWLGPKGVRSLLFLRGLGGFIGVFGLYWSLQYLNLSTATTITFLSPFATGIAGAYILNEPLAKGDLLAGLVSMGGVLLIARPPFIFGETQPDEDGVTSAQRIAGVAVACIGVLGATCAYISIRAIGKRASTMHTTAYFAMQCILFSPPLSVATGARYVIPTNPTFVAILPAVGIFGFTAQTLLTLGLQRETAGRGTLGMYIQLVFAVALEYLVFGILPRGLSVAGISIIIICALYIALSKINSPPKREQTKVPGDDPEVERGLLSDRTSGESTRDSVEVDPRLDPVANPMQVSSE